MTLIAFKHWSITAGSARCGNLFSVEVGKINYFGSRFLMWAVIDLLIKHVRPNQFDGMSRHRDQLAFIRSSVEKSGVKDSVAHWKNHKIRFGTKQKSTMKVDQRIPTSELEHWNKQFCIKTQTILRKYASIVHKRFREMTTYKMLCKFPSCNHFIWFQPPETGCPTSLAIKKTTWFS